MKGLKTYFTFLQRNKLFTVVNVAGLIKVLVGKPKALSTKNKEYEEIK